MKSQNDLTAQSKSSSLLGNGNIIPRKHVEQVLDEAFDRVIFVVAPFGCGKTLAVKSWVLTCEYKSVCLNLDENDNSKSLFFERFAEAVFLMLGQDDADYLKNPAYLNDPRSFILNAAMHKAQNSQDDVFVIDNFHHIKNIELLRFVRDFIEAMLGWMRLVVISREEIPSTYNDLTLKGRICAVSLQELRFTLEETRDYFKINSCNFLEEDLVGLRDDMDGRPSMMNVVVSNFKGGFIPRGEVLYSCMKHFFETEVWINLDMNIRDFLLKTSVLDIMNPSSCRAVTGISATLPILKWLYQNAFFVKLLDEENIYQYYPVFRDFLLEKLDNVGLEVSEMYQKAGWWLYEHNDYERSLPYFFKGRDLYGINAVLKIINSSNMRLERFLELTDCIMALDPEELKAYPIIVARMALVHYLKGNVGEMQNLYEMLIEWSEPGVLPVSWEDYGEYLWEIGWLCYMDPTEPTRANKKHIEHSNYSHYVPHLKEAHFARMAVLTFPSYLRGMRDYGDDGLFDLVLILNNIERGEDIFLDEKESIWVSYLIFAEYKYELEEFSEAEKIIRRIMPLVDESLYIYLYFICTVLLVKIKRVTNEIDSITTLTNRLEQVIVENGHTFLLPNFHAFKLRNQLADGQVGFTEEFKVENCGYEDKPYFYLLYRHITLARGYLSEKRYEEAILVLNGLAELCEKYSRPTDLTEVEVLKSTALYGLEARDEAAMQLIRAMRRVQRYGFIRIFSDEAKDIWPVINIARRSMTGEYILKIIASCEKALTVK